MSALFGSTPQPQTPAAPTAIAPPPDRSDSENANLAAKQRQRFTGAGSATNNFFSSSAGGVSTTTRLLGGGS